MQQNLHRCIVQNKKITAANCKVQMQPRQFAVFPPNWASNATMKKFSTPRPAAAAPATGVIYRLCD